MSNKKGYVYILFNKRNGTGVTSDLVKRIYEHKNNLVEGSTRRRSVHGLGYYEVSESTKAAIAREKQIKAGSRKAKLALIEKINPNWDDLYYKTI